MTYAGYLSNNPLFWSAVAGAAIGGAVASITRRAARSLRPAQARSRKLTTALLFLTIGVAAAALGMLTPPRFSIITYQSLYVFLGALLFFGIALRFPRAAGVPALLVVTLVFIASVAVIREWFPVRDDASLAVAHVLSADEDRFVVEIDDRTPGHVTPNIVDVPGRHIEPVVDVLEVSNYLFFFGTNRGIRLAALSSAIDEPPPPAQSWLAEVVTRRVPLLSLRREIVTPQIINLLRTYRLVGQSTGEVARIETVTE